MKTSINSIAYLSIQRKFKVLLLHSPKGPRRVTKTNLGNKQCDRDTNWILSKYRSSAKTTLSCFIVCVFMWCVCRCLCLCVCVCVFVCWRKLSRMLCLDRSRLPNRNIKFKISLKFTIAKQLFSVYQGLWQENCIFSRYKCSTICYINIYIQTLASLYCVVKRCAFSTNP